MQSGGFVMVPGWLLARKPSGSDLLVYCNLGSHGTWNPGTGKYDECRPAVPTIAEETGLSENTVRKSIKNLVEIAAIEPGAPRYDARGGQLPTVYRVVFGQVAPPPQNLNPPGSESEGGVVQPDTPPGVPKSEPNQEPSTKNPDTQNEKASPSRARRIPDDWKPSPELAAWCLANLVPGARWSDESRRFVIAQTDMFMDHFRASGKPYKDWDATWRNWMRRAFARDWRGPRPGSAAPTSGAPAGQYKSAAVQNAERAERQSTIYKLADELMDKRGMDVDAAIKAATQAIEQREREGATIGVDPCTVLSYIEVDVISTNTQREVTS